MRKTLTSLVLTASLALGGCATFAPFDPGGVSVLEGGSSFTSTIQSPLGRNELYAVENAYGIALSIAVNYRRLPLCRSGETESFRNVCARRSVIVQLQSANRKVRAALLVARGFVRNNQTISAISAIGAARTALSDFQSVMATNGVR